VRKSKLFREGTPTNQKHTMSLFGRHIRKII